MSENKPNYIFATGNIDPLNNKSEGRRYMAVPQKQKYIAVLTEGKLEQEVIDALISCGYTLKRESNHDGCITNHYVKNNNPPKKFKFTLIDDANKNNYKNFSNFGNVCDVTCGMG